MVLATPGLRISGRSAGRSPDIAVLRRPVATTVWIDPAEVLLVIEVVSHGSEDLDRKIKPDEYARAGVPHFWRVERDERAPTVHMYALGSDDRGQPAFVGRRAELLDDLLTSAPPRLA